MRSRQLNIRLSDDELELLKAAAEAEGVTVTAFARTAALEAAQVPEDETGSGFPHWLIALLYLVRIGHRSPGNGNHPQAG